MLRKIGFLLITLLLLPVVTPAHAQTGESLCNDPTKVALMTYDQDLRGTINNESYAYFFCFKGNTGDPVNIEVDTRKGDLDPMVMLYNAEGFAVAQSEADYTNALVGQNDDVISGNLNSRLQLQLPASGYYIIVVTRVNFANGSTTGRFRLTLELADDSSLTPLEATEVATEEATVEATEVATEPANDIIGTWRYAGQGLDLTYTFQSDGTFVQTMNTFGTIISCTGTYYYDGTYLNVDFGYVVDMRPGGCAMGPDYVIIQFSDYYNMILSSPDGYSGQSIGWGNYTRQ